MLCVILAVAIIYRSQRCLVPEPREGVGGYSHLHSHLPAWAETAVECGRAFGLQLARALKMPFP